MAQSNLPSTTNVQLNAGDIAIGAVEIKDSSGAARAAIVTGDNNLANGNQFVTAAVLYGYDGSTYDRIAFIIPASGMSNPTGAIPVVSHLMGYDYSNATWNRLRATEQYGLQVDITRSGSLTVNTELSAAAALADNTVNPTTSLIGACILGFDGTAWDRVTNGGGVEATALRVTIANDSTGVVSVDDNGSALTVDWAGTAPPIGAGTEAAALRVTIATDSTGVLSIDDNASTLTVDQATASNFNAQVVGEVASDSPDSGNPVKIGGVAYNQDGTPPGTAVVEADRANFITDLYGRQYINDVHPNLWKAAADYSAVQTGAQLVAAPGAGLSLYLTDVIISNGATAGAIKIVEDGTVTDIIENLRLGANGGAVINFRTPMRLTAAKNLAVTSTTTDTFSVSVTGFTAP